MRLLIVTQKVDNKDPILGFFHGWIIEFAKWCEFVTVICLEMGEYDLPQNVKVLSLGKEDGKSKVEYVSRFYRYIWNEKDNYDSAFVHMNPEYVLLGGLFWRILGKKVSLWYVHRQTNIKLWVAEKFSNTIFTSSPESFRLISNKIRYVGHGIEISPLCDVKERDLDKLVLLYVGRITPIKRLEVLLDSAVELKKYFRGIKIRFIGSPITSSDVRYFDSLKNTVKNNSLDSHIEFHGDVPHDKIYNKFCEADATINLAPDGGMDKAVIESLSLGRPVFFTNKAFGDKKAG